MLEKEEICTTKNLHLLPSRLYCRLQNLTESSKKNAYIYTFVLLASQALFTAGWELHPTPKMN
ncbi:hypothetical protein UF70_1061 [Staphylococcus pasteuri]|nr:hypothetical protein UF70_1061 [Staphylococcus pasteuri]